MPLKIIEYNSTQYQQMIALRNEILRKPLGIIFTNEDMAAEKNHIHLGAFEDETLLGCCMLVKENENTIKLRQMAVLNDLQGKGIGRALLQFAENISKDMGYKIMIMHARKPALGFYQKMGYEVQSPEFTEVTIPHYVMAKKLQENIIDFHL